MRPPERGGQKPKPPKPQNAAQAIAAQNAAKRQSAAGAGGAGSYGAGNAKPAVNIRNVARDIKPATSLSSGIPADIIAMMRQSGSTDPNDPLNWGAIRAALDAQAAQQAAQQSSYQPGPSDSVLGGGSAPTPAAPTPAVTPVYESPVSYTAPSIIEPPKGVTTGAEGAVGAPSGETFNALGGSNTFGMFERMRNQRTPKTGLSVTPEMLRAAARARLG